MEGPSPDGWSEIWFVSLNRINFAICETLAFIHLIKRPILSKASAILLVSLSAVGADKLDEPKLLKSKAKKRFSTLKVKENSLVDID